MKFLKIFVAAVLLSVCSLAGSNVEFLNIWDGKSVNKDSFTIVAHAGGYGPGETLYVTVTIEKPGEFPRSETAQLITR